MKKETSTHELTAVDRKILKSYEIMLEGLGEYLGKSYEIVLHSLENYEHSVIKIIHGDHTGRTIGSPITDRALKMLQELNTTHHRSIVYFSTNKKNEPMRSTTISIYGENERIIGLLCMNQYLNTPLSEILESLIPGNKEPSASISSENFAKNSDELVLETLHSISVQVKLDSSVSPGNRNKVIIQRLDDTGIFRIKTAVQLTANQLGISKNTVYMHLRNRSKK